MKNIKLTSHNAKLFEQREYYRLGAIEYDDANRELLASTTGAHWEGVYRKGYEDAVEAMRSVTKNRDVLELAGGTGFYTEVLARLAKNLTVLDGARETLDINQRLICKIRDDVEYLVADIFSWRPIRRYEAIVFAFWMSHVPLALFDEFWTNLRDALVPGGEVLFVDSRLSDVEPRGRSDEPLIFRETRVSEETCIRSLADGTSYEIFRVLWTPQQISDRLNNLGWCARLNGDSPWLIGIATQS